MNALSGNFAQLLLWFNAWCVSMNFPFFPHFTFTFRFTAISLQYFAELKVITFILLRLSAFGTILFSSKQECRQSYEGKLLTCDVILGNRIPEMFLFSLVLSCHILITIMEMF